MAVGIMAALRFAGARRDRTVPAQREALLVLAEQASAARSLDDLERAAQSALAVLGVDAGVRLLACEALCDTTAARVRRGETVRVNDIVVEPLVSRGGVFGALSIPARPGAAGSPELFHGVGRLLAVAADNLVTVDCQREDAEVSQRLLALAEGLSSRLEEDALWAHLAAAAREMLGVDWAMALRREEQGGTAVVTVIDGLPENAAASLAGARFPLADVQRLGALFGAPRVLVNKGAALPAPGTVVPGTWLVVPLIHGGWYAGVLVAGYVPGRAGFSRRQIRLAEGLGSHFAIALQNARLFQGLEAADRMKSEFVATMSHELRTPLSVIIGYAELLRSGGAGQLGTEQGEIIERIEARGRELLELIEATLHVSRIQAGRDPVEMADVTIGDLVRVFEAGTEGLPRPRAVEVTWEIAADPGTVIRTDRTKLALAVRNLVSNGLKYTEEGRVHVRIALEPERLVIDVSDTGVGISPEHLPFVFDLFRQGDQAPARRRGGVGLGLYIVDQFTRRLGGTISVESTVGQGSTFRVVLPRARAVAACAA